MKKYLNEHKWTIFIVILFSIISLIPLITNTHRLGHDTNFHIANAAVIERNICITNLFPNLILDGIANNLGYGINLFYPSLPHTVLAYTYHIFKIFNISILDSMAIVYTLITIVSSLFVYLLANKILKNKWLALLSTTIFIFFPYRIGNIIIRSALNETFTFMFMPMILLSLEYLLEKKDNKFYPLFIIGYIGMFNSHLVITLYFTLLLIPFFIINFNKIFKKERLKPLIIATIVVTIIVLPFFVTVLEHKILGNYVVYQDGMMTGLNYMEYYSLNIKDYFKTNIDYMWGVPLFINIFSFVMLMISSVYSIIKKTNKTYLFYYLLTILSFIITLKIFPWRNLPEALYMIQFPWRMETILAISYSICAVIFIKYFKPNKIKYISIGFILLIFSSSIFMINNFMKTDYYTTDILEDNLAMGHSNEYLPVKTNENIDYYYGRNEDIVIKSGDGVVNVNNNKVPNLNFTVTESSDYMILELPRLYYLGYSITSKDGKIKDCYENDNGFLEIIIDGNGDYALTYTGTTTYVVASKLRIVFIIISIGYLAYKLYNKKRKSN